LNFFFTNSIKKPALFSKNINQFEGEVVLRFFYIVFLSYSLILGASCFATVSSEKKIVSIVHTENLITILGGESKKEDNNFNSYKVYTLKRKPNASVFLSYVSIKINKELFKVKLDDLNNFLVDMNKSLKVYSHFIEGEITRRFNSALHIFERKIRDNRNLQNELPQKENSESELPQRDDSPICPQDLRITDTENNNEPIPYQEVKVIFGLSKSPSSRAQDTKEEELIKKVKELENTLKEVQEDLQELLKVSKKKRGSKRFNIKIRPRSRAEKSSAKTEDDDITSPRVTSDEEMLKRHMRKI
jgi:hypothetical protein